MRIRFLFLGVGLVVGSLLSSALPALAHFVHDFAWVDRAPAVQELERLAQDSKQLTRSLALPMDEPRRVAAYRLAQNLGPRLTQLSYLLRQAPSVGPVVARPAANSEQSWEREYGFAARFPQAAHACDANRGSCPVGAPCPPSMVTPAMAGCASCAQPSPIMGQTEFAKWVLRFDQTILTHRRDALLREALTEHYFSAEQAAELMGHFPFDRDRIEVALRLWPRVVDPAHVHVLIDKLAFLHSRNELARRLGAKYPR